MASDPENPMLEDAQLVKACRQGDRAAFGRLVERYQKAALAVALSSVPNFHDAQEIVQEAFLQAYCKLVQLKEPERFKSWLLTIVVNGCRAWQWTLSQLSADEGTIASLLRETLTQVTRLTIGRKEGEDAVLARETYTNEMERIFFPNWSDEERLHGSVGYVNLVVSLPPGKHLTLIQGERIRISNIQSDVSCIGCSGVAVDGADGTVCLYDSHLSQAKNVTGRLLQEFRRFGGGYWGDPQAVRRSGAYETILQKISGEVHLDVGRVAIEASEITGKTCIRNRFGTTRFHQKSPEINGSCQLHSSSGEIHLFLGGQTLGAIHVAAKTLCGKISYSALKGLSLGTWNNPHEMYVGTIDELEKADVQIQTESGDIRIEKAEL